MPHLRQKHRMVAAESLSPVLQRAMQADRSRSVAHRAAQHPRGCDTAQRRERRDDTPRSIIGCVARRADQRDGPPRGRGELGPAGGSLRGDLRVLRSQQGADRRRSQRRAAALPQDADPTPYGNLILPPPAGPPATGPSAPAPASGTTMREAASRRNSRASSIASSSACFIASGNFLIASSSVEASMSNASGSTPAGVSS